MTQPEDRPLTTDELLDQVALLERRVARERTARLEAERIAEDGMRALYRANLDLDARILERTEQLDAALAEARVANRAKSAFLAHMSHHLMTPLNGVVGMLELLGDSEFDEHQRGWHDSALRSARRLDRLVRQLLTYVEVDGVDLLRDAPVHRLSDVLDGVEAQWHVALLRAGQLPAFETTNGRDIWVPDPPELNQLFSEVFSNVIEHTDAGPVTVRIRRVDDHLVAVDIEDSGPGISPQMRSTANSLGVSDDLEHTADGTAGLGLVLMTRIAEAIGGRVRFSDGLPSTVSIELPIVASEES